MRASHRRAHGLAAVLMALAIPAILIIAFSLRADWDAAPAPVQLEAPE